MKDKFPITDQAALTKEEVAQQIKPLVVYMAEEHAQTRRSFKELENVVTSGGFNNVRAFIHEVAIVLLFLGMFFLLSGR